MTRTYEFTDKELVLLYMLLTNKTVPDRFAGALLTSKIEKALFEFMTIAEIENIEDFYRTL